MRMNIRDSETLASIRVPDVTSYLRARGWTLVREAPGRYSIWVLQPESGGVFETLIPDPDVSDYVLAISNVLRTLEAAENRSQASIFRDISLSSADLIRVALSDPFSADGTLSVRAGADAIDRARDLLLAAACATVEPREVFPTRKPADAIAYMEKARLGQTEHGSFVITLISPVSPKLKAQLDWTEESRTHEIDLSEEPFERRVTVVLARAVSAAIGAAKAAVLRNDLAPFKAAVADGVSANFCSALAGLSKYSEPTRGLELGFSWARNRPTPKNLPVRLTITHDVVPVLEEAAQFFVETAPRTDFQLEGSVYGLERGETATTGWVSVLTSIDEKQRKVSMQLEGSTYDLAVQAHKERQWLRCTGELLKEGRAFMLKNPRDLSIRPVEG